MSERLPPAIFLMGPTAAGKTDLALELARVLPCELISVDSALVYRGMDIGTAKPDKATLAEFPHRLIDIRDPAQSYSAADFRTDALRLIAEILSRLLTSRSILLRFWANSADKRWGFTDNSVSIQPDARCKKAFRLQPRLLICIRIKELKEN